EARRHEGRAGGDGQLQRPHRALDVAPGARAGDEAGAAGGRHLAFGQSVDLVVHDDVGDVHVAPDRVQEVVPADGVAVAVAPGGQHRQVAVGQLQAHGRRQRAPVHDVEVVAVDVVADFARAADARDDGYLVGRLAQLEQRPLQGGQNAEVTAAGAPPGLFIGLVVS